MSLGVGVGGRGPWVFLCCVQEQLLREGPPGWGRGLPGCVSVGPPLVEEQVGGSHQGEKRTWGGVGVAAVGAC